jgi:predicted CXXCH cytochrome family protein
MTGRDPTIANPARLSPQRSADICGRCHGQRMAPDIERVHRLGDRFLPGEALAAYSQPLWRDTLQNGEPGLFAARFWPDGTPRLTAYEYQGLLQSACTTRGGLHCTSCHGMHEGDPRGQLRPALARDALCTNCHAELAQDSAKAAHARHPATSAGARCVSCHMPEIVYGIVGAHRSHRIDEPALDGSAATNRPDPCTLCHVDKPRAWAARARRGDTTGGVGEPAEVSRLLIAGDPIERAIAAAALGRADATAAGAAVGPRLGLLADAMQRDLYPAVRAIAFRSFCALLGAHVPNALPKPADFTATASPSQRARSVAQLRARLPAGLLVEPDAALQALRASAGASDVHIAIGE